MDIYLIAYKPPFGTGRYSQPLNNFADVVNECIKFRRQGNTITGVHGKASSYPIKVSDIETAIAAQNDWTQIYAAAGMTLRYN